MQSFRFPFWVVSVKKNQKRFSWQIEKWQHHHIISVGSRICLFLKSFLEFFHPEGNSPLKKERGDKTGKTCFLKKYHIITILLFFMSIFQYSRYIKLPFSLFVWREMPKRQREIFLERPPERRQEGRIMKWCYNYQYVRKSYDNRPPKRREVEYF